MLLSPDREERRHLLRQFYRLVDSFEPANIKRAMRMMQDNRPLFQAFKMRYRPLLRRLPKYLRDESWERILLRATEFLRDRTYFWQLLSPIVDFYADLNELDAIWHLVRHKIDTIAIESPALLKQILLDEDASLRIRIESIWLKKTKISPPAAVNAVLLAQRLQGLQSLRLDECPQWLGFFATHLPHLSPQ